MTVCTPSHASLVPAGVIIDTGTGFGNVNTVLTLQNDNQTGMASGSVERSGGTDVTTGDTLPGAVHNATYSFGELNITNAGDIQLIFNADEPGNILANGIMLNSLVLSIYSSAGGPALFSASLIAPQVFPVTETGVGRSGFVFELDMLQALAAQPFITATNRLGLASTISMATGGPDTFYVLEGHGVIPEPGSVALLGLGLAGMLVARRRSARVKT